MEAAANLRELLKLSDPSGKNTGEFVSLLDKVPEFQNKLESLATTPDEFNRFYSERGWAAYESMKFEVMENGKCGILTERWKNR